VRDEERTDPPLIADEEATFVGFLEFHRDTFLWKIDGLTPEQMRRAASPPSDLSLWGLLRHLADVDRGWLHGLDGEPTERLFPGDSDLVVPLDADLEADLATFRSVCERSRAIVAAHDLDDTLTRRDETFSLRWILVHLVEEYARHNGHADLLRQAIDGATGE
jgi:uncharacterized damage-inducible protein DinB